ncbi:MAG: Hpt domain-containing protein [Alphaproteobacteria bacterium]
MVEEFDVDTFNIVKDAMGTEVVDLVEVYIKNSSNYVDVIRESFQSKNYNAVADAAHPLKSSSASLGVIRVSSVSEEIESLCESGTLDPNSEDALEKLIAQLPELFKNAKVFLTKSIQEFK